MTVLTWETGRPPTHMTSAGTVTHVDNRDAYYQRLSDAVAAGDPKAAELNDRRARIAAGELSPPRLGWLTR